VLEVDPTDSLRLAMGDDHEPGLVGLLPRLLREGDLAVDGGAHICYLSLHMSRCVGETGRVIAFEPDPDTYRLLQCNLARNRCHNVRAVPAGLWSAVGRGQLYRCDHHHGDHRMWDPGGGRPSVAVERTTLDYELSADPAPLRLVKLDVQGAELEVLHGMEQLFRRSQLPILVLELWPRGLRGCGSEPRDLVDLLVGHGYSFSQLSEDGSAPTPVDPVAFLRRLEPADRMGRMLARFRRRDDADLLCVPPDVVV
jgi:FkbM family methyltransferase